MKWFYLVVNIGDVVGNYQRFVESSRHGNEKQTQVHGVREIFQFSNFPLTNNGDDWVHCHYYLICQDYLHIHGPGISFCFRNSSLLSEF